MCFWVALSARPESDNQEPVMRIHVNDAGSVDALVGDLLRGGCVPARVDDETVDVIHPDATDAREARTELGFFLRAWQSRHPEVVLTISY
jgi:hypothetical protein